MTDELLFAVRRIASARAVVCGARRDDESPVRFCCTASRSVAKTLKKPESYVAVCVVDRADIVWGGSDDDCALCRLTSLGGIDLENNKAVSEDVCALLGETFGIAGTRVYVTFEDVARENMGYDSATFAG